MPFDIESWCRSGEDQNRDLTTSSQTSSSLVTQLEQNFTLADILINEDIKDFEDFFQKVKFRLEHQQKLDNLHVYLENPGFPFDNAAFEDPYFLVEEETFQSPGIENILAIPQDQLYDLLKKYFSENTIRNFSHNYPSKDSIETFNQRKKQLRDLSLNPLKGKGLIIKRKVLLQKLTPGLRKKIRHNHSAIWQGSKNKSSRTNMAISRKKVSRSLNLEKSLEKATLSSRHFAVQEKAGKKIIKEKDFYYRQKSSQGQGHILLALDASRSMQSEGKLAFSKEAVLALSQTISRYNVNLSISVVAFNDKIRNVSPERVLELKSEGLTHFPELYDYIQKHFRKRQDRKNFLIIISDGFPQHAKINDTLYHSMTLSSAKKLEAIDLQSYILLLGAANKRSETSKHFNKQIGGILNAALLECQSENIAEELSLLLNNILSL